MLNLRAKPCLYAALIYSGMRDKACYFRVGEVRPSENWIIGRGNLCVITSIL